jgi:hypothetical protein
MAAADRLRYAWWPQVDTADGEQHLDRGAASQSKRGKAKAAMPTSNSTATLAEMQTKKAAGSQGGIGSGGNLTVKESRSTGAPSVPKGGGASMGAQRLCYLPFRTAALKHCALCSMSDLQNGPLHMQWRAEAPMQLGWCREGHGPRSAMRSDRRANQAIGIIDRRADQIAR